MHVDVRRAERVVAHVDDDPLIGFGSAFVGHVECAAHKAVAAVAGHQIARGHVALAAVVALHRDLHARVVLRELLQLMAEQHLHMRETLEALIKNLVHLRLDEGVAARPAELVGAWFDRCEALAARGVETHPVIGGDVRLYLLGQASGLQRAQRFVVDADGARVVDHLVELFDDQHLHASKAQRVGDGQADRACADDDHVMRVGWFLSRRGVCHGQSP